MGDGHGERGLPAVKKSGMNRAFLIVLGPTALVAAGYIFVLREMGLEPPYWKLAGVVVVIGLGFWWIGRRHARHARLKLQREQRGNEEAAG